VKGIKAKRKDSNGMLLMALMERYLSAQRQAKSSGTVRSYRGRLRVFSKYLKAAGCNSPGDLNAGKLAVFAQQLETKNLATNARYVYLEQVKQFIKWLYQELYLLVDLSEEVRLPKWERKAKKQYAAARKLAMIGAVAKQEPWKSRNQAILALYLYEGLKKVEIKELSILDLDFGCQALRLRQRKIFKKLSKIICL
jgi:site-specific recombinase XerD